jgi:hypothetical protein
MKGSDERAPLRIARHEGGSRIAALEEALA